MTQPWPFAESDLAHQEERRLLFATLDSIRSANPRDSMTVLRQVPMGRRRADLLVALSSGTLIAVELKLGDWQRALGQAALNQLWVDRSYIAIPLTGASIRAATEAARHGIGVIVVDGGAGRILCDAPESTIIEETRRQELVDLVNR